MSRNKNSLTRQVRRAYRQDELARILTMPEADFGRAYAMETTEVAQRGWKAPAGTPNDFYHFKDNGARVLAVAHLDTVVKPDRRTPHFYGTPDGPAVTCGSLDDRLGAFVILQLLPRLGLATDVLLTTGEESCSSTAAFFTTEKTYDHVIEFDRGGTDVVMYDYDDAATRRLVRASGAPVGQGSFTDICMLEQLRVKAFNWGVGYRGNYHSEAGYAVLSDTFMMVAKYLRFHAQNAGIAMPHVPAPKYASTYGSSTYGQYGKYDKYDKYSTAGYRAGGHEQDCDLCGAFGAVDEVTGYCEICDSCADCNEEREACQCWLPRYLAQKDWKNDSRNGTGWPAEGNGDTTGKWLPWYMRPENKDDQDGSPATGTWTATPIAIEAAKPEPGKDWDRDPTQAELDQIQAEIDEEEAEEDKEEAEAELEAEEIDAQAYLAG